MRQAMTLLLLNIIYNLPLLVFKKMVKFCCIDRLTMSGGEKIMCLCKSNI